MIGTAPDFSRHKGKPMFDFGRSPIRSIDDLRNLEAQFPASDFAELTTYELIRKRADESPGAPSLIYLPTAELDAEPVRWTRSDLLEAIHKTANALHALGVGATDVVSFMLPNILEVQAVFWGSQAAGIVNPINYLLDVEQIGRILNLTKSKVLIVPGAPAGDEILKKALQVRKNVPTLRTVIVIGGAADLPPECQDYDDLCRSVPGDRLLSGRKIASGDIATIFHTSGTTGQPKLVPHTHANEVAGAVATAMLFGFSERDVINNAMPMFHVAAPMLLSLAPLAAGARIFMPTAAGMRSAQVLQNYWKFIELYQLTVPGGVPTSLLELANIPIGDADLSGVRFFMTGGAPLSSGLAEAFGAYTGKPVCQIYGMTETSGVIAASPPHAALAGDQIGFCAPFMEISVRRSAADGTYRECTAGENGELFVRGPNVAKLPDRHKNTGDWLSTGDIGSIGPDGVLLITGRSKDVIIRSGHNIDPAMIEDVVNLHPAVLASVAVGLPDMRAGEVPVVFILPQPGVLVDTDAILQFAQANMPERPAKPTAIFAIDAFPMNAVGKIYRPKLRCKAVETIIKSEIEQSEIEQYCEVNIEVEINESGMIYCKIQLNGKQNNIIDQNAVQKIVDDIDSKLRRYKINFETQLFF